MSIHSVSVSLVVPGISVTMARSSPSKLLKRLDLPTFGRPTTATLIPSRRSRPERNVRASRDKSAVSPRSDSRILSCSSAGRSSSTNSSEDSSRTIIFRRSSFAGWIIFEISPLSWRVAWCTAASVCASIRSRMASASVSCMRPLLTARSENSPGPARRASRESVISIIVRNNTGDPWQCNSTTSSPVKECGDLKKQTSPSSRVSPPLGSMRVFKLKRLGEGSNKSDPTSVCRIRSASGPLSLMTPIPPRPGGVDNATMVSVWMNTARLVLSTVRDESGKTITSEWLAVGASYLRRSIR